MSMTQHPIDSVADIATPNATRYLTQLCKHFQHRCPAWFQDGAGEVTLPSGTCLLRSHDGVLTLSLRAADDARMAQLREVVVRHLVRFAFREELRIDWTPEPKGASGGTPTVAAA